jgi:tetratricopeptide (TPR) repeat protein
VIDRADEYLDRALALAPQSLAVRLKRGEYYLRLGIYPLAQIELQEAIRLAEPEQRRTASYAYALLLYARQQGRSGFVRDTSMARLAALCAYVTPVFAGLTGVLRKGIARVLAALNYPASCRADKNAFPQGGV